MSKAASPDSFTQADMAQRLPPAEVVDRTDYLVAAVGGRRVGHVGFVDAGCWAYHEGLGVWLHATLAAAAADIVGLDVDASGVSLAQDLGFAAHEVDACDEEAVAGLGLDAFDVVVAGEVIEHLHSTGPFLDAMHHLVGRGGRLVVTTPNASGLLNAVAAATLSAEVNHPDHVGLFSCFTLTNLLERHDWEVEEVRTYIPVVKDLRSLRGRSLLLGVATWVLLGVERLLGRLGRPYAADGLIVSARSRRV